MTTAEYEIACMAMMSDPQKMLFQAEMARVRKDPTTGILFAALLGGIGVHRFYLSDLTGIVYVLFCWTLVPAMLALLEAFAMKQRVEDYNKQQAHLIASRILAR